MKIRIALLFSASCLLFSSCGKDGDTPAPVNRFTVIEYTPAPGQFINNPKLGFSGAEIDACRAVEYAANALSRGEVISLGGFGGFIVVKFDRSITSSGGYDFSVRGNQVFAGSSEPGIVWVASDVNGNGLPDDEWYELAGSQHGKDTKGYSVTYSRPSGPRENVAWEDNLGNSGTIDWLSLHENDSYYPAWLEGESSYTLSGTLLTAPEELGDGYSQPGDYEWGYADNYSLVDMVREGGQKTLFSISNAVDSAGEPAALESIDFVKVQTGVNGKGVGIGEFSTEVGGFTDETGRTVATATPE